MPKAIAKASHAVFTVSENRLRVGLDSHSGEPVAIDTRSLAARGGRILGCDQAPGIETGSIRLSLIVEANGSHHVLTALLPDPEKALADRKVDPGLFKPVLTSTAPISKISSTRDGIFASANDGALFYADANGVRPKVHTLLNAVPAELSRAALLSATDSAGPMADILAAKDGIEEFLTNLIDGLPKIIGAVEIKVGEDLLSAFGADIKAQQKTLGSLFNKPLAALIQQSQQTSANRAPAAQSLSSGEQADHAVRRLFASKLEINRLLNPFPEVALAPIVAEAAPNPAGASGDDPLEALGKLFQPLSSMLDAKNLQGLLAMGAEDLLEAISGSKPISDVLGDFFGIFKVDETMGSLSSILGGGQCSKLLAQIPLKDYLAKPVDNAFFTALYDHYFPGKTFTMLDLCALMGALFGYVAFAAQGKSDDFRTLFGDQQAVAELASIPAKLVETISGSSPPPPLRAAMHSRTLEDETSDTARPEPMAPRAPVPPPPPPSPLGPVTKPTTEAALAVVPYVVTALLTLGIGTVGAFSFGTGLIASPMTAGIAASFGQCLGGIAKNRDTSDAKWDLLGGFAGGFSGAFVATLIGNQLFGRWAQNGDTPSARIRKLRIIMAACTATLGGGGGAVVSSLLKNYAKSGKLVFDDPLALTTGALGGIGGGAMGCGLHFMGALSGSGCLPLAMSRAEAANIAMNATTPDPPLAMNNAAALPARNPNFPPALATNMAMGIYRSEFNDGAAQPTSGRSIAFCKWNEFTAMDGPPSPNTYFGQRERLFWLEAGPLGAAPAATRRADLVIGVHGIGRYVFPCITHSSPTIAGFAARVEFTRPMYKDDFVELLAADAWLTNYLAGIRANRSPIIKLGVCFSALPLGCCSLSQELATGLDATVYGGRPPVYPHLDDNRAPRVPGLGGWVRYDP